MDPDLVAKHIDTPSNLLTGFQNHPEVAPVSLEDLEREYCRLTNQPYPISEMVFTRSWMLFRVRPHLPSQSLILITLPHSFL